MPRKFQKLACAAISASLFSCAVIPGPAANAEDRLGLVRTERVANVAAPDQDPDERRVSALQAPAEGTAENAGKDSGAVHLLYVHGTPGDAEGWADYLLDPVDGLTSTALDRPGFGMSDSSSLPTLEGQSRALAPFLSPDGPPTIVIGHSYGGPIALQAALDFPDQVAGVVVLAGSVSPDLEKRRWFNYAAKGLSWVLPHALRRSNQEVWPLKADLARLSKRLAEIEIPVAIMHGTEDGLVPYGNATFMMEALSRAKPLTLTTLEGAGHMFIWSSDYAACVRQTIHELAARVAAPE